MDNFINGVRISDPIVNISHNINTDVAEDILGLDILGEGGLAEASNSEESKELEHDVVGEVLDVDLSISLKETGIYTWPYLSNYDYIKWEYTIHP